MTAHRLEVARRGPWFGLAQPALSPGLLGASDSAGGTLYAGDILAVDGSMICVRTAQVVPVGLRELSVPDQLLDEQTRLAEHTGVDGRPEEPAVQSAGELQVNGSALPAEVWRDPVLRAARVAVVPDLLVPVPITVLGRGVALDQVRLVTVSDMEPYWRGRESQLADFASRHVRLRSEDLDLPPATGLDAHHALVQFCLGESAATRAQLLAGERPGPRPGRTDRRQRLWEGAVRAQWHLGKPCRSTAGPSRTQRSAARSLPQGFHGYHPQLATCPQTGPVLMCRLRGGSAAGSVASFLTDTLSRVRNAGRHRPAERPRTAPPAPRRCSRPRSRGTSGSPSPPGSAS